MSDFLIEVQDALIAGDFIKAYELLNQFGDDAPNQAYAALKQLADDQEEMGF